MFYDHVDHFFLQYYFIYVFFYWWIIALQCCGDLCYTSMQISHNHIYIYIYIPSLLSLPSLPILQYYFMKHRQGSKDVNILDLVKFSSKAKLGSLSTIGRWSTVEIPVAEKKRLSLQIDPVNLLLKSCVAVGKPFIPFTLTSSSVRQSLTFLPALSVYIQ